MSIVLSVWQLFEHQTSLDVRVGVLLPIAWEISHARARTHTLVHTDTRTEREEGGEREREKVKAEETGEAGREVAGCMSQHPYEPDQH